MTENDHSHAPCLCPINPVDSFFHATKIRYFYQNCLVFRFFYIFLQNKVAIGNGTIHGIQVLGQNEKTEMAVVVIGSFCCVELC